MRSYNAAPHSTTKVATSLLMLGHSRSDGKPQAFENLDLENVHKFSKHNDQKAKDGWKKNSTVLRPGEQDHSSG